MDYETPNAAGRTIRFDTADLAMITGALITERERYRKAAAWCAGQGDNEEAAIALRHAAHCTRLLKRL